MVTIINVFMFLLNVMLIALIIVIAKKKNLNLILWSILSVGGYLILWVVFSIINFIRTFFFNPYRNMIEMHQQMEYIYPSRPRVDPANIVFSAIPFLYLIVLLIIVSTKHKKAESLKNYNEAKPTQSTSYINCSNCENQVKEHLHYCPYCGETPQANKH